MSRDSSNGVEAAQAAGMRCIAYVPTGDAAPYQALDGEVLRDMHGLLTLLT